MHDGVSAAPASPAAPAWSGARLTVRRMRNGLLATAAFALVAMVLALLYGGVSLDPSRVVSGVGPDRLIFFQVRLPRVLLAAWVGAALAVAGAGLQPMLRNPLASPDIIGVSGGAALAAVASLALLPIGFVGEILVPLVAFVGAVVSSVIVYRLSLVRGRAEPYTQILVGVIFNTVAASLILVINAMVDLLRSQSIVFWLMGGIELHSYRVLMLVAVLIVVGTLVLIRESPSLNLLALGDEGAEQLGVDLASSRRRVFAAASLMVGAAVSLTGVITFVGLIVPHVLRRVLGSDNRLLVPASFFGGAAFLVLCDLAARVVIAPSELPVGAITALTGGPFFVYLLRRRVRPMSERDG